MKVLMIGPLSPPHGGVANFIESVVRQEVFKDIKIHIHRVGRRKYKTNVLKQFIIDFLDLLSFILKTKFRDIDIVHIHTSSNISFYRKTIYFFIVKFLSSKKTIIHVHGANFENFYEKSSLFTKKLIKYVLSNSDAVIVTSQKWVPIFKNIMRCNKQIYVIYNGFDSNLFKPKPISEIRNRINLPTDKKILLNIAALEKYKGHIYLIYAIEIVKKEKKDILVYVIGEGSLKEKLKKVIKNKQLESNIFLLGGGKSSEELINFVNACDIFVLSSLAEGNPTVMFEALSCGKPFVGTKVGGIPDIIFDEDYGFLVEPKNPKELAEKILKALDKKWNYDVIIEYAQNFTWKKISKNILQIYEKIV